MKRKKKNKRKERKKNISGGILENIPYATLDRLQAVVKLLMWWPDSQPRKEACITFCVHYQQGKVQRCKTEDEGASTVRKAWPTDLEFLVKARLSCTLSAASQTYPKAASGPIDVNSHPLLFH